jgi:hypothetical protein
MRCVFNTDTGYLVRSSRTLNALVDHELGRSEGKHIHDILALESIWDIVYRYLDDFKNSIK